jgi:hypothetical protein
VQLVAAPQTLQKIAEAGGDVYLWARGTRCCAGYSYDLQAATTPPERHFRRVHEEGGISVWAPPGLPEPDEVHLELGRRGKLRAYWNGQAWIG